MASTSRRRSYRSPSWERAACSDTNWCTAHWGIACEKKSMRSRCRHSHPKKHSVDKLRIAGGRPLEGGVRISGAKNAALPVMAATLLAPGVHTLRNVPRLRDTQTFARVLELLGSRIAFEGNLMTIDSSGVNSV